jgi:hypothetical protein
MGITLGKPSRPLYASRARAAECRSSWAPASRCLPPTSTCCPGPARPRPAGAPHAPPAKPGTPHFRRHAHDLQTLGTQNWPSCIRSRPHPRTSLSRSLIGDPGRSRSVAAAQDGVTQRVRHEWVAEAHIAAVLAPSPTGRHGRPRRTRTGVLSRREAGCGWFSAGLTLGVPADLRLRVADWASRLRQPVCLQSGAGSRISLAPGSPAEE